MPSEDSAGYANQAEAANKISLLSLLSYTPTFLRVGPGPHPNAEQRGSRSALWFPSQLLALFWPSPS
jgi:hypothetical protein